MLSTRSRSLTASNSSGSLGEFNVDYSLTNKLLGRGSFGQVVQAFSSSSGQKRAVKMISLVGKGGARRLQDAKREAEVLRSAGKHKNCVSLLRSYQETTHHIMVMEKCRCSLLDALGWILHSSHTSFLQAVEGMTRGLAHVHGRGIVHRDLKPENFLLGGSDGCTVKLCDFGLADFAPSWGQLLQGTCGTLAYMSPEMASGQGHTLSTDLWSLGATIYLLVFGDIPVRPSNFNCRKAMKIALAIGYPAPAFAYASDRLQRRPVEVVELVVRFLQRSSSLRCSAAHALRTPPFGCIAKRLQSLLCCGSQNASQSPSPTLTKLASVEIGKKKVSARTPPPCRPASQITLPAQVREIPGFQRTTVVQL